VRAGGRTHSFEVVMVDYDFIMDGDWSHRVRLFNLLSAEEKAEFVQTHRRRWLTANRHRLSAEQIAAIEETTSFIVAALYVDPRDPALETRLRELEQQAIRLFEGYDLYDLTLHGHRVPDDSTRGLGA
jgi:hypothetical protein